MGGTVPGQQNYDDFEGNKFQNFGFSSGVLDSGFVNPKADDINSSSKCVKYKRASPVKYDIILMYPNRKLIDISMYSTHIVASEKIKIKVYTTAPPGTLVELQLGIRSDNNYPTGIHSQYQAVTTLQNSWEELTFNFSQIPEGSLAAQNSIDKLILLFSPGSSNDDTYYFDDLTGPDLIPLSGEMPPIKNDFELSQNVPNPVSNTTIIKYDLISAGTRVSLKLYDKLGKEISTLVDHKQQVTGTYQLTFNFENLSAGIYFYVLKIDQLVKSKKIIIYR